MNTNYWRILADITFKTQGYRKNFDLLSEYDNFITEYDGSITHIRITEHKPPVFVGEYGFSVWNIEMCKKFGANFNHLIEDHMIESTYIELNNVIEQKLFNLEDYKKVIFIHSFILKPDYRKMEITEEFIEMLYRDFYDDNVAIIALVKPFQNNPVDADYYYNNKTILVKEDPVDANKVEKVPATEYYSLGDFERKRDTELNEYKLFALASRCGFGRIGESYLFKFSPEKIIERMNEKKSNIQTFEII